MASERIFIYEVSANGSLGAQINDVDRQAEYATDLRFGSRFPGGYDTCSFKIRVADIFGASAIRESQTVIVWDGDNVWEGRINDIDRIMSEGEAYYQVNCTGWIVVLASDRRVRARWVDNAPLNHLEWPAALLQDNAQNSFVPNKRDNFIQVLFGTKDVSRDGELYKERYALPAGQYVQRVTYNYKMRTGEAARIIIYNVDDTEVEHTATQSSVPTGYTGNVDCTLAYGNTNSIELWFGPNTTDLYDQNDYALMSDAVIYVKYQAAHPNVASPAYTSGEIIKDLILLLKALEANTPLSDDLDGIGEPGRTLVPFTWEEYAAPLDIINEIARYGDSSNRTWGIFVGGRQGTSDDRPKVEFFYIDTSDYDYTVAAGDYEIVNLTYRRSGTNLRNYIVEEYTDERNSTRYRTPTDNAALKDDASIAAEYRREHVIKAGKATATTVDYLGTRYLAFHKDRQPGGSIVVSGTIRGKAGEEVPVNRVRAGQRIKLLDTGETVFIRQTNYDAETQRLTISPDAPDDGLESIQAWKRREEQLERAKAATAKARLA